MHLMKFSSFVVFYFVLVLGVSSVKIVHLFYFGEVAELVDARCLEAVLNKTDELPTSTVACEGAAIKLD